MLNNSKDNRDGLPPDLGLSNLTNPAVAHSTRSDLTMTEDNGVKMNVLSPGRR